MCVCLYTVNILITNAIQLVKYHAHYTEYDASGRLCFPYAYVVLGDVFNICVSSNLPSIHERNMGNCQAVKEEILRKIHQATEALWH